MQDTMSVANKLVELCRAGKNMEAVDTLYSQSIVSVEAMSAGPSPAKTEGLKAVREKNQWWMDNHEVHHAEVDGPYPHGDRFIVRFDYDVTGKGGPMAGKRMNMKEAALYTVEDGKITHEEFFYSMGG